MIEDFSKLSPEKQGGVMKAGDEAILNSFFRFTKEGAVFWLNNAAKELLKEIGIPESNELNFQKILLKLKVSPEFFRLLIEKNAVHSKESSFLGVLRNETRQKFYMLMGTLVEADAPKPFNAFYQSQFIEVDAPRALEIGLRHINFENHGELIDLLSALAVEKDKKDTAPHLKRTETNMGILAKLMQESGNWEINDEFCEQVQHFAPLHDIGKIKTPAEVLEKPGVFDNPLDFVQMRAHVIDGVRIVQNLDLPAVATNIILYHHARFDGLGYPAELKIKGEEIALEGRMMAIVDAYDAIRAKRCYKSPISKEEAIVQLQNGTGKAFDPQIVEIFIRNIDRFVAPEEETP